MPADAWIRVDLDHLDNPPALLRPSDDCYFLREYTSHGGYAASTGNQDIENFKKERHLEGTPQWHYKGVAARKFARELAALIGDDPWTLMAIPTSKLKSDAEYDPRFDMLFDHLKRHCPQVRIVEPLRRRQSVQALHKGGDRRIRAVYDSLHWVGFDDDPPSELVLLDDVLTHGTSYRACMKHIHQHHPDMELAGVFWTRCIWPDAPEDDDDDEDDD